ncbi:MAG: lysophospholipid acyltransferase family protein [Paludibacter sp.]
MGLRKTPPFIIYQWIIAFPILLAITILVALVTIILSPLFPNSKLSYYPARWWGRVICKICFVRLKITGLEHLKPKQSYIFVLNHQSIFDIFVVYGWLPYIFKWLMKIELRKIPLVGIACESAGHIFINRRNPITTKHSIEKAEMQLKNGVSLVVFPEGTRTYTGEMGKFKRGAFQIASDLSLPIVPVTLRGSFERLHRNTIDVTPGTIEMHIHQPIEINQDVSVTSSVLMNVTWNVIHSSL